MNKIYLLIIVLIVIIGGILIWQNKDEFSDWKTYNLSQIGISFDYPSILIHQWKCCKYGDLGFSESGYSNIAILRNNPNPSVDMDKYMKEETEGSIEIFVSALNFPWDIYYKKNEYHEEINSSGIKFYVWDRAKYKTIALEIKDPLNAFYVRVLNITIRTGDKNLIDEISSIFSRIKESIKEIPRISEEELLKPHLQVVSPFYKEEWTEGNNYEISFINFGYPKAEKVDIEIFSEDRSLGFIASGVNANEKYIWRIPEGLISDNNISIPTLMKIVVYNSDNPEIYAESSFFTIKGFVEKNLPGEYDKSCLESSSIIKKIDKSFFNYIQDLNKDYSFYFIASENYNKYSVYLYNKKNDCMFFIGEMIRSLGDYITYDVDFHTPTIARISGGGGDMGHYFTDTHYLDLQKKEIVFSIKLETEKHITFEYKNNKYKIEPKIEVYPDEACGFPVNTDKQLTVTLKDFWINGKPTNILSEPISFSGYDCDVIKVTSMVLDKDIKTANIKYSNIKPIIVDLTPIYSDNLPSLSFE